MSRTGARSAFNRSEGGFTLLEMVVVLVLITLTAGMAVPTFVNFYHESRLRAGLRLLLSACSEAREQAILLRQPVRMEWDLENARFRLTQRVQVFVGQAETVSAKQVDPGEAFFAEMHTQTTTPDPLNPSSFSVAWEYQPLSSRFGREHELPATLRVAELRSLPEGGSVDQILFYPDGQADPVRIVLENQVGHRVGIEIEEGTGNIRTLSEQELEGFPL